MTHEFLNAAVVAALISAVGVFFGGFLSFTIARQQVRLKVRELEDAFERFEKDLTARTEIALQGQMTEVVKKRIETYPALYRIISDYGRTWELSGKTFNEEWCSAFLSELLNNNGKNGAYLTNVVYGSYCHLRDFLQELNSRLYDGRVATAKDVETLYAIIRGVDGGPGLGSFIKNELGAEIPAFTSVLHEWRRSGSQPRHQRQPNKGMESTR